MQDYEEPDLNIISTSNSPSVYSKIRAWLLHSREELPTEFINGNLINLKVIYIFPGIYLHR